MPLYGPGGNRSYFKGVSTDFGPRGRNGGSFLETPEAGQRIGGSPRNTRNTQKTQQIGAPRNSHHTQEFRSEGEIVPNGAIYEGSIGKEAQR